MALHKAIIPFLTVAFGGVAVGPVILSLLENLDQMDESSPWITLFEKTTRRHSAREMHFAAVDSNEVSTKIRYAVARLEVQDSTTQVLFLKATNFKADFETATTTMGCDNGLLAMIEPQLRQKLSAQIGSMIASANVG